MIKWARYFLFLLAPSIAAPQPADPQAAAVYSRRGLELARAGDLRASEAELRRAVAAAPDRPDYLLKLGGVLALQQKFADALPVFENALRLQPGDPVILRSLAASQWGVGRLEEATRNLEQVLRLRPQDVEGTFLLGMIAERTGEYEKAAALLTSIAPAVERRPDGMVSLASANYRTGRRLEAARLLERVLKLSPPPELLFRGVQSALAAADRETADNLLATIRFRNPEAIAPEDRRAREGQYAELIRALAGMGQPAAALDAAELALKDVPDSALLHASRGLLEMQLHRYLQAVGSYRRANELGPANADFALGVAVAQTAAGMATEAEGTLEKSLALFPDNALIHLQYGILLLQVAERGATDAATRAKVHLRRAIALDPLLAEPHFRLGNAAIAEDNLLDAIRHLEAAVKLDPGGSKIHLALARAYNRVGRQEEASRLQRRFLELKAKEEKMIIPLSSMGNR
jgi:tetratricopeptide (TPR) repeat protein